MNVQPQDKIFGGLAEVAPSQVASWRHLRRFVLIIVGISFVTLFQARHAPSAPVTSRIPLYLVLIGVEAILVWFVAIGIHTHGYKLRDLVGRRWQRVSDGITDVVLAIGALVVLRLCTLGLYLLLGRWPSHTGFLLPKSLAESVVWCAVATTAGICEELVYRGYLQRQLWSLTQSVLFAIILQATIFGSAHLYQGWKPALVTASYGLVLGFLAAWRRSIIPGAIAHSITDLIGGLLPG